MKLLISLHWSYKVSYLLLHLKLYLELLYLH